MERLVMGFGVELKRHGAEHLLLRGIVLGPLNGCICEERPARRYRLDFVPAPNPHAQDLLLLPLLYFSHGFGADQPRIAEMQQNRHGGYRDYLRLKLRDTANASLAGVQKTTLTRIPFGEYRYLLRRSDLKKWMMGDIAGFVSVNVNERERFVHLAGPSNLFSTPDGDVVIADYDNPEPIELSGRVSGHPVTKQMWVAVWKRFSADGAVARFGPDGIFRAAFPFDGDYIAAIYNDGTLLNGTSFAIAPESSNAELRVAISKDRH